MANLNKGGENATNLYKEALAQAQKGWAISRCSLKPSRNKGRTTMLKGMPNLKSTPKVYTFGVLFGYFIFQKSSQQDFSVYRRP